MINVLVTGVGAIIGYGVLRSLQLVKNDIKLIGADIYPDAVGRAWCDEFEAAPLTVAAEYFEWLSRVVCSHRIDLVIPAIEQDVHFLSDNRVALKELPCKFVLNAKRLIDLSRDKWEMHEELASISDVARIPSYIDGTYDFFVETLGLPFILKPRQGYASKGIVRVNNGAQFQSFEHKLGAEYIVQPIIGNDEDEYTVSIFGDGVGNVLASISLRRRLAPDGSTAKAWVENIESLNMTVRRLCAHFKPVGPTNLQFRKDGDMWRLLEINPRISSATSIRAAFGYNESDMSVGYFYRGDEIVQPVIRSGFAARFIEDYVTYDRNHF